MNDTELTSKPVENLLDLIIKSLALDLRYKTVSLEPSALASVSKPEIKFELSGPDASLLTANDGELLHAIEHIDAKILNLEPEQHDRISLDAESFKQKRDHSLLRAAEAAIARVRQTGQPYAFPPMSSRERRALHLALEDSGLPTASSGEPPRRFVVLYPKAAMPSLSSPSMPPQARTQSIRAAFRPR